MAARSKTQPSPAYSWRGLTGIQLAEAIREHRAARRETAQKILAKPKRKR
jgi:hypothetical protein